MAISASTPSAPAGAAPTKAPAARDNDNKQSGNSSNSGNRTDNKPDVSAIMAGIHRTVRERNAEGGKTERDFKADLRKRMLQPFSARGFTEDFTERVRSRETSRWNISLSRPQFHSGGFPLGVLRLILSPLARLLVNFHPAVEAAERQAEINEYHRRLLWATNRDLELTRLELDVVKRELRGLGVDAEFSFARAPAEETGRGGRSRRSDGRGGRERGDRGGRERGERGERGDRRERGDGRRDGGGRSDRSDRSDREGGRRERGSRPHRGGRGGRDRGRGGDRSSDRSSDRGRGGRSDREGGRSSDNGRSDGNGRSGGR